MNGRVSALLELGAGFNPEFTGRDNVYLNGVDPGTTTREIDRRYQDIEEFAEIGDFINQPVKTYSSGMVVRLAFAVAINVDPEILLVDEALAVGDIYFRQRCMRKVHELRARGITILFVSHAIADVKAIGDRVLWLEHGRVIDIGEPDRVIAQVSGRHGREGLAYLLLKTSARAAARRPHACRAEVVETIPNIDHRYGDGRARDDRHRRARTNTASRCTCSTPCNAHRGAHQRARRAKTWPCPTWASCCAISWASISRAPTPRAKDTRLPPMQPGDVCTVDFHLDLPELYPGVVFLFAGRSPTAR